MSYHITDMFTKKEFQKTGLVKYHYTFEFSFASKEQYLEQTANWKTHYKDLSQRIRQSKLERKPKYRKAGDYEWTVQRRIEELQQEAHMMCQIRVQAKAHASRLMVRQKAAA